MVNMRISKSLLAGRFKLKQCQLFSTGVSREDNIIQSTYKVKSPESPLTSHYSLQSIQIPTANAADVCMARFAEWSDLPGLECAVTEKMLTYSNIRDLARRFGAQLLQQGLKPGDKIGTMVPNCPEFGPILLGSLGVGVTVVPISPLLSSPEVSRILDIARPRLVITADPLIPVLSQAVRDQVRLVVVLFH